MSAFKRINVPDSFVVPYTANKSWSIPSSSFSAYNIAFNVGTKYDDSFFDANNESLFNGQYDRLIYDLIGITYYPEFVSKTVNTASMQGTIFNDGTLSTSSYYNGRVNLGNLDTERYFPTLPTEQIYTLSFSRQITGDKILPTTFEISFDNGVTFSKIYDDGNYNLRYSGSNVLATNGYTTLSQSAYVGNIFYEQNMAVITYIPENFIYNTISISGSNTDVMLNHTDISFKNNHVIYENFVKCTIKDYEYNLSYNPTLLSGSQGVLTMYSSSNGGNTVYVTPSDNFGILKDFTTGSISGSEFSPYVTTVGLYNDSQELLAVAKMASPIPISANTDMTFLVKWDTNFTSPLSYSCKNYSVYKASPTVLPTSVTYTDCNGSRQTVPIGDYETITFCAVENSLDVYTNGGGSLVVTENGSCS